MRFLVRLYSSCAVFALSATLAAAPTSAQGVPTPGAQSNRDTLAAPSKGNKYRGRILGLFDENTGAPIAGAEVFDVASGWNALTTTTGTVSLVFLADGGSLIRIRKVGYAPLLVPIAISPADTIPVTLTLSRLTELPAVVTRDTARHFIAPGLNDFEQRARQRVTGYFITDSLLRKSEHRMLGSLIRSQFPGASVREGAGSAMYLVSTAMCSSGPEVYLDGIPMNSAGVPAVRDATGKTQTPGIKKTLFNLSSINVSELAGVEFYPSTDEVPIEFPHTTTGCGALMLWTRER